MKKTTTQAFLLLCLLCLSFQVRVNQAGREICVSPSPPCGAPPKRSEESPGHTYKKPCKPIPRPPPPRDC
ncbi:hypothetical protein CARUB_v10018352mg [Capsella rubella]|uniref:Uncharacterized protein n=1 Tax=Capsella rubella TaxID=81985 RepID=R0FRY7_9BRAS|nr:hypothetical protein CARUB_v10018352mg [Capsella rubella]